jgi:hypothetical protein
VYRYSFKIIDKIQQEKYPREQLLRSGFCDALVSCVKFITMKVEYVQELMVIMLENIRERNFNDALLRRTAAPVLERMLQNEHRVDSLVLNGLAILAEVQLRVSRVDANDYQAYTEFMQVFLSQKKLMGDKDYKERVRDLLQLYYETVLADARFKAHLAGHKFTEIVTEWKRISTALELD